MALSSFEKQPSERFVISVSFANNLDTDEAVDLASSSVTAMDSAGEDATATVLAVATLSLVGTDTLKVQVKDGLEAGTPYKITFTCVTDAAVYNVWEKDVKMKVKEL